MESVSSPPAIHGNIRARDIGGFVRPKEHRNAANLLGLCNSPHRRLAVDELVELFLLKLLVSPRRFDESRTDTVDTDAFAGIIDSGFAGEVHDATFGRGVHCRTRAADEPKD